MIEFLPRSQGRIVGIKVTGKLTDADYHEVLIPKLDSLFSQHGKLDVLFHMDKDFEGWDLKAAWDDASYGLKHRADFEKLAIVGGPHWVEGCIRFAGFLMKGEVRTFPSDKVDEAWRWITPENG